MSKKFGTVTDAMPLPLSQDYGSYEGAGVLADRITAYWRQRGSRVPAVMVVDDRSNRSDRDRRYNIRSTMIGGWP